MKWFRRYLRGTGPAVAPDTSLDELLGSAIARHQEGELEAAEAAYRQVLEISPDHAQARHMLGAVLGQRGEFARALQELGEVIARQPELAAAHVDFANILALQGQAQAAAQAYRRAIALEPGNPVAHNNLGNLLRETGELDEALQHCERAVALHPEYAEAYNNLGLVRQARGDFDGAVADCRRALSLVPGYPQAWNNLGFALQARGQRVDAIAAYRKALELREDFVVAWNNLAIALLGEGDTDEARECYRVILGLQPDTATRLKLALILPPVMESREAIAATRVALAEAIVSISRDSPRIDDPLQEVGRTNFHLAYHGENDRDIQVSIARLYEKASPTLFYTAPHCEAHRSPAAGRRIAVGFISTFFRNHTIGHMTRGYIAGLDRSRFHVTVFGFPQAEDDMARSIRDSADQRVELPMDLERAQRMIAGCALDILYYTDIGMEAITYFLAFARLAPVQCVSWGHPDTTGIPNVDYFVSSEDLEVADAQEHYSERLVRLPSLSAYYTRPVVPSSLKSREHFGLETADHIYLCPQSLFKLHPDDDIVMGEILRRDPAGRIVLIAQHSDRFVALLKQRFAHSIPGEADRILFIPPVGAADYLNLVAVSDAVLDPLHFGGGRSTAEILAVGTPIVTLPGRHLRNRITYACYRKIGVCDCIAADRESYVSTAYRLANDSVYREQVHRRLLASNERLYEDGAVTRELETFFCEALARSRHGAPATGIDAEK